MFYGYKKPLNNNILRLEHLEWYSINKNLTNKKSEKSIKLIKMYNEASFNCKVIIERIYIVVWLRNQMIPTGLEPVVLLCYSKLSKIRYDK